MEAIEQAALLGKRRPGRPAGSVTKSVHPEEKKKKGGRPRRGTTRNTPERVTQLVNAGITSPSAIAEITGTTSEAARQALSKYFPDINKIEKYKVNRADIIAGVQERVISRLAKCNLKGTGVRDLAVSFGVLYDKERLERGESTSNLAGIVKVLKVADSVDKGQG